MKKTPRQRRKEKNRESILDDATNLILKNGLENVSLREIAEEADYSPAALYRYFDSKEAIIQAVKARESQKLIENLAEICPNLPAPQRLIEMCMVYVQYNLTNPVLLSLINNLTTDRRSKQEPIPQTSPFIIFLGAVEAWANYEKIQLPKSYGIEEITYALWAQIHGMATLRLNQLRNFEADFDKTNQRSIEFFLNGVKTGVR